MKRFISMLLFFALLFGVIVIPDRAEAMEQAKEEREAAAVIEKPPESVKSEDRVETEQTDVDEEQQKKGKDVQENKEWYRILPSDEVEVREVPGEEPDTDITREASVVLALNSGSSASVKSVEEVVLQVGERVSYGSWSTNYFYINGQLAYCLEPRKGTPSSGNYIADVLQNDHLTKGMYYLMGGPGFTPEIREAFFSSAAGFSEKQIYAFCHAILSFIYSGYNLNSDAFIGLNKEERDGISTISYQIRDMLPAPPEGKVSIQPPHQNAKWNEESKSQWTDVYQVEGDARNLLKFTLPAGVRLHNLITGAVMQSAATVKGGDQFRLEAEPGVSGHWTSGKIKGSIQETYMSFLIRPPGDDQAVGGLAYHREPELTTEFSVEWMSQGKIRIHKVSGEDGRVLAGAEFGIYARDRIEKNGVVLADAGQLVAKLTTDKAGMGESPYLPSEAYYLVKELKAPDGYGITEDLKKGCEVYLGNQSEIMENGVPVVVLNIKNDLKRCDLTIKKVIRRSDIVWANGNPTFLFRVSGVDLEGREHTYVRSVEFTKAYVEQNIEWTGNVSMEAVFEDIPCGRQYSVSEVETNRYVLQNVTSADKNVVIQRNTESRYGIVPEQIFTVTADLLQKPKGSSVTFFNKKIRWDDWSHNSIVINPVKIEK